MKTREWNYTKRTASDTAKCDCRRYFCIMKEAKIRQLIDMQEFEYVDHAKPLEDKE